MQTQVPLNELKPSASNVRQAETSIDNLASSILSIGLLQPLLVTVAASGGYEVVAGSRRLAALNKLVEDKHYDDDRPISVNILSADSSQTEASLAENIIRAGMTAADEVVAFKKLAEEGDDAQGIAHRFGYRVRHVEQRLALANLAPAVFECFAAGGMTLETAQVFTLNPDHARQVAVLEKCSHNGRVSQDWIVRREILDEAVRGDDIRAKLIGREAFIEAGGTVYADLFDDDEGSFWTPSSLLQDLTEAAMLVEAEKVKGKQKLDFVRCFAQSYKPYDEPNLFEVHGNRPKKASIGDVQVGRILLLKNDGTLELAPGYFTDRKLKNGAAAAASPLDSKSVDSISAKARKALAEQRRDVLRVNLMRRPELSQSVLTFILVDKMMAEHGYYDTPTGSNASLSPSGYEGAGASSGHEAVKDQPAAVNLRSLADALDHSWLKVGDGSRYGSKGQWATERCELFLRLDADEQQKWAALALCHSLRATSTCDGSGSRFHDYLGNRMEIDVRKDWSPTVDSYFGFLSKGQMLAKIEPVDADVAKAAAKQKTGEVKDLAADMANGGKLAEFVPTELTFPAPELDFNYVEPAADVAVQADDEIDEEDAMEDVAA